MPTRSTTCASTVSVTRRGARGTVLLALLALPLLALPLLTTACADDDPAATTGDTSADADPRLIDLQDPACTDATWSAPSQSAPLATHTTATSADHIPIVAELKITTHPPSSGNHRPGWAKWGEYSYLPPQRWLHNLEHGGVALLYHPCAGKAVAEALYQLAKSIPDDDSGAFRFVLTPYPGLPSAVAAVTWEWTWLNSEVDTAGLQAFITAHYRKAPEDFGMAGDYDLAWLRD